MTFEEFGVGAVVAVFRFLILEVCAIHNPVAQARLAQADLPAMPDTLYYPPVVRAGGQALMFVPGIFAVDNTVAPVHTNVPCPGRPLVFNRAGEVSSRGGEVSSRGGEGSGLGGEGSGRGGKKARQEQEPGPGGEEPGPGVKEPGPGG